MQAKAKDLQNLGRLKKRSEFLCAAQSGFKWVSPSVIVQIDPRTNDEINANADIPDFRFGVTATKKIGNAPVRNRIKRRLRAAIKDIKSERQDLFEKLNAAHIVLIGRDTTADIEFKQLKKDMQWCLKRLHQRINEKSAGQG
jgi:ribonuclease P protein component